MAGTSHGSVGVSVMGFSPVVRDGGSCVARELAVLTFQDKCVAPKKLARKLAAQRSRIITNVALSAWEIRSGAFSILFMCVVAQLTNRKKKEMIKIDFFIFHLQNFGLWG